MTKRSASQRRQARRAMTAVLDQPSAHPGAHGKSPNAARAHLETVPLWRALGRAMAWTSPERQRDVIDTAEVTGAIALDRGDDRLLLAMFWSQLDASRLDVSVWRHLFARTGVFVHVDALWLPSIVERPAEPLRLYRYTTPERTHRTPWSTREGARRYGEARRQALLHLGAVPGPEEIPRLRMFSAVFEPERVWASFADRPGAFREWAVDPEGVEVTEVDA